jgi:hypothetical protein
MRLWHSFTLFVATVAALENPHRKVGSVKQHTKKAVKRDGRNFPTSYQYLDNKTERE